MLLLLLPLLVQGDRRGHQPRHLHRAAVQGQPRPEPGQVRSGVRRGCWGGCDCEAGGCGGVLLPRMNLEAAQQRCSTLYWCAHPPPGSLLPAACRMLVQQGACGGLQGAAAAPGGGAAGGAGRSIPSAASSTGGSGAVGGCGSGGSSGASRQGMILLALLTCKIDAHRRRCRDPCSFHSLGADNGIARRSRRQNLAVSSSHGDSNATEGSLGPMPVPAAGGSFVPGLL